MSRWARSAPVQGSYFEDRLRPTAHAELAEDLGHVPFDGPGAFGEVGDKWVATECVDGLAFIASAQGHFWRAARVLGAAEAARETFGITIRRPDREDHKRLAATTREGLGDAAFAAAWAEVRAMALEQAIE